MKPLPVAQRPPCWVCGKRLKPNSRWVVQGVSDEEAKRLRETQPRIYEPLGLKLRFVSGIGGDYTVTCEQFDGTYGWNGEGQFHSLNCAATYGQLAARLRPRIHFERRKA